jgi:hypothetical protein
MSRVARKALTRKDKKADEVKSDDGPVGQSSSFFEGGLDMMMDSLKDPVTGQMILFPFETGPARGGVPIPVEEQLERARRSKHGVGPAGLHSAKDEGAQQRELPVQEIRMSPDKGANPEREGLRTPAEEQVRQFDKVRVSLERSVKANPVDQGVTETERSSLNEAARQNLELGKERERLDSVTRASLKDQVAHHTRMALEDAVFNKIFARAQQSLMTTVMGHIHNQIQFFFGEMDKMKKVIEQGAKAAEEREEVSRRENKSRIAAIEADLEELRELFRKLKECPTNKEEWKGVEGAGGYPPPTADWQEPASETIEAGSDAGSSQDEYEHSEAGTAPVVLNNLNRAERPVTFLRQL